MSDELLQHRLDLLINRLRTSYEGIGHSSGRPYVYFVYPPALERQMQRMVDDQLHDIDMLRFHFIDVLPLTIDSLRGREERRQQLLSDPFQADSAAEDILRLWARKLGRMINSMLATTQSGEQPVFVLRNLAALHPLGNPTSLMEYLAEQEPRHPLTGTIVPIVLLVPGIRPPQSSRLYLFLGQDRLRFDFYRGEEI